MRVFVLSKEGIPLMPTTQRRARLWLKARRAKVVRHEPFTIQLRFETTGYTQPVTVGVDTGSKTVGIATIVPGETLLAGWLPPAVSSQLAATLKAVQFAASLLPVHQVNVEIAGFDTQKMRNPEITGGAYQQGTLFGYQVREYLLEKWQRTCAYCGATDSALQVEHIVPQGRGSSDRVDNLTLACAPCNQRKGNGTAAEFGFPQLQVQARLPLRDAAHVSALKTALLTQLTRQFGEQQVQVRYGYQTKYQRIQVLKLSKSHAHDAVAIACELGEGITPLPVVWQMRCLPRGSYQRLNGKRSEHKVWAPRKVKGWRLYELVEAKGHRGYIGGRREKGSFLVKDLASGKTLVEAAPSKLLRLRRPSQGWLMSRLPTSYLVAKQGDASSPSKKQGYLRRSDHGFGVTDGYLHEDPQRILDLLTYALKHQPTRNGDSS